MPEVKGITLQQAIDAGLQAHEEIAQRFESVCHCGHIFCDHGNKQIAPEINREDACLVAGCDCDEFWFADLKELQ